ncbi:hypothetical protein AB0G74_07510 [Streptomyces sp. NPDC020875]|uniref:hypothetical protein n=1 Tax=Streptomyces sp. NPDC020875 TaxID=3154898 RepID=UPI0033C2B824
MTFTAHAPYTRFAGPPAGGTAALIARAYGGPAVAFEPEAGTPVRPAIVRTDTRTDTDGDE